MKIPFKPISRMGKLSAWLILFAVLTFFTLYTLAELLDVLHLSQKQLGCA